MTIEEDGPWMDFRTADSEPVSFGAVEAPTASPRLPKGMTADDFDHVVRTVYGEAAGEPELGQQAVAAVIANRARQSGRTHTDVVKAPWQFEPWMTRRRELESLDPASDKYQRIAKSIFPILNGEVDDPTGGATHFYSPRVQRALGRSAPTWDNGSGVDLGNHRFFNLGYGGKGPHGIPQQTAAAKPAPLPGRMALGGDAPAAEGDDEAGPDLWSSHLDPDNPDDERPEGEGDDLLPAAGGGMPAADGPWNDYKKVAAKGGAASDGPWNDYKKTDAKKGEEKSPDGKGSGVVENILNPQQYKELAKGVVPGAVSMQGSALQGVDATAARAQYGARDFGTRQIAAMDRIDRGESVPETDDPMGYQHMGAADRKAARAELEKAQKAFNPTPIQDRPFYKAGEAIQEWSKGNKPDWYFNDTMKEMAPKAGYEQSVGRQLGEGLGSMVGGLPYAMVGSIPAGIFFGASGAGEATQRAVEYDKKERKEGRPGLTQEQIAIAGIMGIAPGTTDILPIETLMGRIPLPIPAGLKGPLAQAIGRIGGQAFVEGFQEGGQQFLQNLIAREVYNPNQALGEDVLGNTGIGSGVGAIAQTGKEVGGAILRRRGGHGAAPGSAAEEPPQIGGPPKALPAPGSTVAEPSAPPPPTSDETGWLRARGYRDDEIAAMGPDERAAEIEEAKAQGLKPAPVEKAPDNPSAEPVSDLVAQAKDFADQKNTRQGVYLPAPSLDVLKSDEKSAEDFVKALGDNHVVLNNFDDKGGALIVPDEEIAAAVEQAKANGHDLQEIIGLLTGAGNGKPANGSIVVQQRDKAGNVTRETLTTPEGLAQAKKDLAAPGRTVHTLTPDQVVQRRNDLIAGKTGTRTSPVRVESAADIEAASRRVTVPTDAQREQGNYAKGHLNYKGLQISIETPKGAMRRGDGWEVVSPAAYGYFKGVPARAGDKEHVDVYVGDNVRSDAAFIVDQHDLKTGRFDEPKVILGARSAADAASIYDAGFSDGKGPERRRAVSQVSIDQLKDWLENGDATKPFARVRGLAKDEAALSGPEQQGLSGVRRAGNRGVSPVDAQLRELSGGHGPASDNATLGGQDRREAGVRSEQLPMGNEGAAVAESSGVRSQPQVGGQDADGSRVGPRAANARDNDLQSSARGIADKRSVGSDEGSARNDSNNADVPRKDDADQGMGTRDGRATLNDQAEAGQGLADRSRSQRYEGPALTDDEIDGIVSSWQFVREAAAAPKPQTLTQYVIAAGGIRDDAREVRHIMGAAKERPGLVNKRGATLDDMALSAWESGFFESSERPTIAEFLDKLQDDLRTGAEVRPADDFAVESQRMAAELAEELSNDYGITANRFRSEASLREYLGQERSRVAGEAARDQGEAPGQAAQAPAARRDAEEREGRRSAEGLEPATGERDGGVRNPEDTYERGAEPAEVSNDTVEDRGSGRDGSGERGSGVEAARETGPSDSRATGFKTAKGSTYVVHADGTTTRNKAARPEHPGEEGPQPRSQRTYYVEDPDALGIFQTEGPKRIVQDGKSDRIGVVPLDGPNKGKILKTSVTPFSREPKIGWTPVEVWKAGTKVHFGNPIVDITQEEPKADREGFNTDRALYEGYQQARGGEGAPKQRTADHLQDYAGQEIDGYNDDGEQKHKFLVDARNYLTKVAKILKAEGFEAFPDKKGKAGKPVNVNQAGPAVSGEVSINLIDRDGNGVYAQIGGSGVVYEGEEPGIRLYARRASEADRYGAKSTNQWLSVDLSAKELAAKLRDIARPPKAPAPAITTEKSGQTSLVPEATTKEKIAAEAKAKERRGGNEPMDVGMFGSEKDQTDLVDMAKAPKDEKEAYDPWKGERPDKPDFDFIPNSGWRDHLFRARVYANALRIDHNGKSLEELVKAIDDATTAHTGVPDGVKVWMSDSTLDDEEARLKGGEYHAYASREKPYSVVDGYGATPNAAMRDAVAKLGAEKPSRLGKGLGDLMSKPGGQAKAVEKMVARETEAETVASPQQKLVDRLMGEGFKTIVEARKFAKEIGLEGTNKQIDEAVEQAVVVAARQIVEEGKAPADTYQALVDLYGRQPNLASRTGTSVANQAYSTPMPLAYLASRLASVRSADVVYEPTAGNGALLMEAGPGNDAVYANEIDPARAKALSDLGFTVSEEDAGKPRKIEQPADAIVANPPFGAVKEGGKSRTFKVDGWSTTQIDHAVSLNALDNLTPDGKAVLILGGTKSEAIAERRKDYRGKAKREFYARLYKQYNVTDHFTVSGDLYTKQGASWPVDVIVIEGRGQSQRKLPAAEPPAILKSWDELAEKLPNEAGRDELEARSVDKQARKPAEGRAEPAGRDVGDKPAPVGRGAERVQSEAEGEPAAVRPERDRRESGDVGSRGDDNVAQPRSDRDGGRTDNAADAKPVRPRVKREAKEGASQVPYEPISTVAALDTLIPVNMASAAREAMEKVEKRRGSLDAFVADRLGYKSDAEGPYFIDAKGEKKRPFAAEQIDALAAAIDNIERGNAFINGSQTGIGKGRSAAGVLRYAMKKGLTPVFLTEKPDLYGDMFRDLRDIGVPEMLGREPRMFITNAGETITLDEEALSWKQEAEEARANGEQVPPRRGKFLIGGTAGKVQENMKKIANGEDIADVIFTTYDQMNTVKGQDTPRRKFLAQIAPGSVIVMDEAHVAGGAAKTGWEKKDAPMNRADFARELAAKAKGVMFSSATYAKRPDVMDLYARTDMGKAVDDPKDLGELIQRGGVPMQQIVASMLAKSGQYMRHERSFDGVDYQLTTVPVDEKAYKQFSSAMQAIFRFDLEVEEIRKKWGEDKLDEMGFAKSRDDGVGSGSASSISFGSLMHNITNQMLLAIKAESTAQQAIKAHKAGEKPVIALANTNESFIKDFAEGEGIKAGQPLDLNFSAVLERYLQRTLRITVKSPEGERTHIQMPLDELPTSLRQEYQEAMNQIKAGKWDSLPISPIDWIRYRLGEAGISVREVTGRQTMIDYSKPVPTYTQRPKSEMGASGKRGSIAAFNAGRLDALILNRSGSTGVSMHASKDFKDQRKRRMILAQAEGNIDTHLQMIGRVHRTGQVIPPAYSQIAADIPAEARPTAVLMKKMASLNANTTGARSSAFTVESVDFINEVGDKVVADILLEDPELNDKLGEPLTFDDKNSPKIEDVARKATGRLVLLDPEVQAKFLDQVQKAYVAEVEQLDALGENPLEAKTVDLQAKTVETSELKPTQGDSPFLDAVRLEKVTAKAQGRAMSPAEVAGKVADFIKAKKPDTSNPAQALAALEAQGRTWKDAEVSRVSSLIRQQMAQEVAETKPENKEATRRRLEAQHQRFLDTFAVAYPGARITLGTSAGDVQGVVMSVERTGKAKQMGALGSWTVKMAVADSMRQIDFPMSKLFPQGTPKSEDEKGATIARSGISHADMVQAFEDARREGRETRYVVTGNILGGFDQTRGRGRIVNFTNDKGELRPGILMGREFSAEKFMDSRAVRFREAGHMSEFLQKAPLAKIESRTGEIELSQYRDGYRIEMSSARAKAGQFFTDKAVRDALGGADFQKRGSRMVADELSKAQFEKAVAEMAKIGAKFEVRDQQDLAQSIVSKPGAAFAVGSDLERAGVPDRTDFKSVIPDIRRAMGSILKSGRPVSINGAVVTAIHKAVDEVRGMVPAGAKVYALARVEPTEEPGTVIAVFEDENGQEYPLTESWNYLSSIRAAYFQGNIFIVRLSPRALGDLGKFNGSVAAELGHEVAHALRWSGRLGGATWGRLLDHARSLRLLDGEFGTYLKIVGDPSADKVADVTTREVYERLYNTRENRAELMDQEEVAHLVEWYMRGELSRAQVEPVIDILDDIVAGRVQAADREESLEREMAFAAAEQGRTQRRDLDRLGFYSKALEAAKDLRQAKGTPEQMRAMLRTAGVKEAELKATGLDDWLAERARAVSGEEAGRSFKASVRDGVLVDPGRVDGPLPSEAERGEFIKAQGWAGVNLEAPYGQIVITDPAAARILKPGQALREGEVRAYHGSNTSFDRIDPTKFQTVETTGDLGNGFYATADRAVAQSIAEGRVRASGGTPSVMEVAIQSARVPEVTYDSFMNAATRWVQNSQQAQQSGDRTGRQPDNRRSREPIISKDEIVSFLRENRVEVKEKQYSGRKGSNEPVSKWQSYSIDPSNPTYRETVIHLPMPQMKAKVEPMSPFGPRGEGEAMWEGRTLVRGVEEAPFEIGGQWGRITHWPETFDWKGNPKGEAYIVNSPNFQNARFSSLDDAIRAIEGSYNGDSINDAMGKAREDVFRSGHWSEPNVIAHARTSLQKTADGKTVFLVDELQSDWGQKLRDGGVRDEAKIAELRKRLKEIDDKANAEIAAVRPEVDAIEERFGLFPILRDRHYIGDAVKAMTTKWAESEDDLRAVLEPPRQRLIAAYDDWMQQKRLVEAEIKTAEAATPGHPLVNTTDQWTTTAFRRLIRQAVEAGADYIALTPGKVQVEDRNFGEFSARVPEIDVRPQADGLRFVLPRGEGGRTLGRMTVNAEGIIQSADGPFADQVEGKKLSDAVGPEVADAVMAVSADQVLKTGDIRIGGKGMMYAYDQMYPHALLKMLQKMDKSVALKDQPLNSSLDGRTFTLKNEAQDRDAADQILEGMSGNVDAALEVARQQRAEAASLGDTPLTEMRVAEADRTIATLEQIKAGKKPAKLGAIQFHAFPLTSKVKEAVMEEGQPMFAIGGGPDLGTTPKTIRAWHASARPISSFATGPSDGVGGGQEYPGSTSFATNERVTGRSGGAWADAVRAETGAEPHIYEVEINTSGLVLNTRLPFEQQTAEVKSYLLRNEERIRREWVPQRIQFRGKPADLSDPLQYAGVMMRARLGDRAEALTDAKEDLAAAPKGQRSFFSAVVKAIADKTEPVADLFNAGQSIREQYGVRPSGGPSTPLEFGAIISGDEVVVLDMRRVKIVSPGMEEKGAILNSFIPPKVQADLSASISEAINIVNRIAGPTVSVRFQDTIGADGLVSDAQRAATEGAGFRSETMGGFYKPASLDAGAIIGLATNDPKFDLLTTAGHEAWHHVEEALASPAEKRLITSAPEMRRMRAKAGEEIGLAVGDPRLDAIPEKEIRAIAFQKYRREREEGIQPQGIHIGVRRFWDRILKIFAVVRNAMGGHGLKTYEDVFERARVGEFARESAAQAGAAQRPSSTAVPASATMDEEFKELDLLREEGMSTEPVESPLPTSTNRGSVGQNEGASAPSGVSGDLDMSPAARKARAEAMGFDTSKVWYRGRAGDEPLKAFDTSRQGYRFRDRHGGIFLSSSYRTAEGYARYHANANMLDRQRQERERPARGLERFFGKSEPDFAPTGAEVISLYVRPGRQAVIDINDVGGDLTAIDLRAEIQKRKDRGYDSVVVRNSPDAWVKNEDGGYADELVVFDPVNIRSINAAFDLAESDSSTLMASLIPRAIQQSVNSSLNRLQPRLDRVRVGLQDKFLPVRRIQEEKERQTGTRIPINLDTYVAEALFHGRAGEQTADLKTDFVEPLVDILRKADISKDQFDNYLYARHARERNDAIALIDPSNTAGSGMTNQEADAILNAARPKQASYDAAAKLVDTMLEETRKRLLRAGLIDRETFDQWQSQYANYVPLRGWESGSEEAGRSSTGRGFDIRGPEARQALGRRSKADSPLAYAIEQATTSIVRAEKNRVDKTLYRFIQAYPDPALYRTYTGEARRRVNPSTGLVETYWVPPAFVRQDNIHGVKIGGKQYYMELKDPGLARAMRGVQGEQHNAVLRGMMWLSRTYASLLTSYNPEFVVSNFFRDIQTALLNVTDVADKPADVRRQMVKDALSLKSIRGVMNALRGDGNSEFARWFEEYRQAGGKISFMEFNDVERIQRDVNASIERGRFRRATAKALELVNDLNTAVENGVRLSVYASMRKAGISQDRAAFVARELTVNFNRKGEWSPFINSMYLFFNASVQGTTRMAQAIMRSRTLQVGVASIAGMAFMVDWWNYLIAGDDDDGKNRYDKIAPWIKERNLIIMSGRKDGSYAQIPMPYGYNLFWLGGQQTAAAMRGAVKPHEAALNIAKATFEVLSPVGGANGSFLQLLSPTMLDPFVQIVENKTWYGGPIYPTKFNKHQPNSETYSSSIHPWFVDVARTLNRFDVPWLGITGGNTARAGTLDISPEVLEHLVEFAGGGVARFMSNVVKSGTRTYNGQEWLPEKTPFVRRVYGKAITESRRRDFYKEWDEVDAAKYEVDNLIKNLRPGAKGQASRDEIAAAREKYAVELQAYEGMRAAQRQLAAMRKQRTEIELNRTLSSKEKEERLQEIINRENGVVLRSLGVLNRLRKANKQPKDRVPETVE